MKPTILGAGAEGTVSLVGETVVKERPSKRYRHPLLDEELRRSRTRREAKILQKLPVPGPKLLSTDRESVIEMEFLNGSMVKSLLEKNLDLAGRIGETLAKLHDAHIIHGDLTTSNMIVVDGVLHLIDFGLSFTSPDVEHKAVDIHLFKQALESKHHAVFDRAYRRFLKGYRSSPAASKVLERLAAVERRGKNKAKV
jgi:Kae1-associated kinase Bud32